MSRAEYFREYRAHRAAAGRPVPSGGPRPAPNREKRKRDRAAGVGRKYRMPVMMVDSEGGAYQGRHVLAALVAASDGGVELSYAPGRPIGTLEVLSWLLTLPDDHLIVGYSLGYDYAMWLRDLPVEDRRALRRGDAWVSVGPFQVNLTGTRLSVTRTDGRCRWDVEKRRRVHVEGHRCRSVQVHDCFKFFQSSFLQAIGHGKGGWKVVTEEELAVITAGKAGRAEFDLAYASGPECVAYSLAECRVGARLIERLKVAVEEALGEPLRQFFGAGSLAKLLLRKNGVEAFLGEGGWPPGTPPEVREAVMRAYLGGRFESAVFGPVPGPVFELDITSAYPAQMRGLPCLTHASWQHVGADVRFVNGPTAAMYASLWRVRWELPDDAVWGPFPFRLDDGCIVGPRRGEGWYWREEVAAAMAMWPGAVEVVDGWVLVKGCQCRPFDWVAETYEWRQARGDKNDGPGIVAKLGLNSLYGACAQSVGHPTFQSFVWAGLITSGTRAALLRAMTLAPDAVFMVATDAVYSTRPLPIEAPGLGGWELTMHEDAFVVAPGVALLGGKVKSRGVAQRDFARAAGPLREAWRTMGPLATVTARTRRFIGLGAGVVRPHAFCQWEDVDRVMAVGAGSKREHPPVGGLLGWPEPYWTRAAAGPGGLSAPYDGRVSPDTQLLIDQRTEAVEQPALDMELGEAWFE